MRITKSRGRTLLVPVLIALALWGGVILYAVDGPYPWMPSARWLELAVWTGVLFWIVAKTYRACWRSISFWLKVASCLVAHLCAWTVLLKSVSEWNQWWFIPPVLMEGVVIMMVLDKLGVHSSGAK